MLWLGIILGLLAAACQSLSYLGSRWYTLQRGGGGVRGFFRLLVISHVLQGAAAIPLVLLIYPLLPMRLPADTWPWLLPALGVGVFYMSAQLGLFVALHHTEASRVSPFLGVKVAVLAVVATLVLGDRLTGGQWAAVALAVAAAFVLNYTGGSVPWQAVAGVLYACVGYSLSDTCIQLMIDGMHPLPELWAAVFGLGVVYVACGLGSVVFLPWLGSRRPADWTQAVPYAAAWLLAMVFLFTCFAAVGVVFGNILQSTRGLISILLAVPLARWGILQLEARVSRGVFWRRTAAAAMMTAAIALFITERQGDDTRTRETDQAGAVLRGDELPRAGLGGLLADTRGPCRDLRRPGADAG